MTDQLRTPFFIAALILMCLVVGVEVGGGLLISGSPPANICAQLPDEGGLRDECDPTEINGLSEEVPGLAIASMALVDGILLFTLGLMAASLVISNALQGKIQGIVTLIFAICILLGAIAAGIAAFGKIIAMVSMLFAFPFGTIAYFALYASFARSAASAVLSGVMLLKIGFIVCLLLAQQRFAQNKGLVLMILTALLANVVIGLLHGFVPIFLVSITDAIAAVVMAVLSGVWAIVLGVGAVMAIVKAVT